jgi:probable phosphoglycerate mutase
MSTPRRFSQEPFQLPPGSTELILVRHGASADVVEGEAFDLLDGQGDPPLSPIGREQAELVGARLARTSFEDIYISTLRRTAETAAPLARLTGKRPIVEPDVREIFLGEWEGGQFRQKVADRDPIALRMFAEQRWDVVPGAESSSDFRARLRGAAERIAASHPDQRVIVFSHGAAIGELLAQATGSAPFAFLHSDNTAIARLVIAPGGWMIRGFGDIAHLKP